MTPEKQKRIHEAAEELRGTPQSIHDVLTQAEIDDQEFIDGIDELVFECTVCGWWCERGEESQSPTKTDEEECADCAPNEEEE